MKNFLEEYSILLDNSKEHLSNQALATYLNLKDVLSEKEKLFIDSHLKLCSKCRDNYEKIVAEDKEMDKIIFEGKSEITKNESKNNSRIIKLLRYSAVASIIIFVGLSFYYLLTMEEESKITQVNKNNNKIDSVTTKTDQGTIKSPEISGKEKLEVEKQPINFNNEIFAVNTVLENFINRNTRSNINFKIIKPKIGDTVTTPIAFKWEQFVQTDSNKLIIVDNKNRTIYQETTAGSELEVNQNFKSGLYYWKLLSNDKLEVVGKFYLR